MGRVDVEVFRDGAGPEVAIVAVERRRGPRKIRVGNELDGGLDVGMARAGHARKSAGAVAAAGGQRQVDDEAATPCVGQRFDRVEATKVEGRGLRPSRQRRNQAHDPSPKPGRKLSHFRHDGIKRRFADGCQNFGPDERKAGLEPCAASRPAATSASPRAMNAKRATELFLERRRAGPIARGLTPARRAGPRARWVMQDGGGSRPR
jgi:hypothetical protein